MRIVPVARDVVVKNPTGKGAHAYPTIGRETHTLMFGKTPVKHKVVFADGKILNFPPAWIAPIVNTAPDAPQIGSLVECLECPDTKQH
ncbi:hypothetical protein FKW31_03635 [Acetobacter sp. DmW_136]|uniref:hypothetical protein n=1 Tax=Acetobacter sp. DmW_136 TaxID=2591091 RepID=UPI001238F638|nr:hypothetical protein [Acetobacter sp. DmW_136]KAA8387740.1 hypothetical protein FKW31_03635 [Acetobacter sp. DmW_136]